MYVMYVNKKTLEHTFSIMKVSDMISFTYLILSVYKRD